MRRHPDGVAWATREYYTFGAVMVGGDLCHRVVAAEYKVDADKLVVIGHAIGYAVVIVVVKRDSVFAVVVGDGVGYYVIKTGKTNPVVPIMVGRNTANSVVARGADTGVLVVISLNEVEQIVAAADTDTAVPVAIGPHEGDAVVPTQDKDSGPLIVRGVDPVNGNYVTKKAKEVDSGVEIPDLPMRNGDSFHEDAIIGDTIVAGRLVPRDGMPFHVDCDIAAVDLDAVGPRCSEILRDHVKP